METLTDISVEEMEELLGLGPEYVTHLSVPLDEEPETHEELKTHLELDSLEQLRFEKEMIEWHEKYNQDRQAAKIRVEAYISGYLAGYIGQADAMVVAARDELKRFVELHRNAVMGAAMTQWNIGKKCRVECSLALNYVFTSKFFLS